MGGADNGGGVDCCMRSAVSSLVDDELNDDNRIRGGTGGGSLTVEANWTCLIPFVGEVELIAGFNPFTGGGGMGL